MTVIRADGICSRISLEQEGYMRWKDSDSKWVLEEWDCDLKQWIDKNFDVDTLSGPLKFWIDDASGKPRLEIAGITRRLTRVCGGQGVVIFSGGTLEMCGGGSSAPAPVECDNDFQIKLECVCCPIDGWQGEGYYCVVDADQDCETDSPVATLLEDPCDDSVVICSCRYDTLNEAEAACPAQEYVDCNGNPIPVYIWIDILAVAPSSGGGSACPEGPVTPFRVLGTWDGIQGWDFAAESPDFVPGVSGWQFANARIIAD